MYKSRLSIFNTLETSNLSRVCFDSNRGKSWYIVGENGDFIGESGDFVAGGQEFKEISSFIEGIMPQGQDGANDQV